VGEVEQPGVAVSRIWIVGRGTVGRWVADAITDNRALEERYGVAFEIVGSATRRGGFTEPGGRQWADPLEGMRATEADVLVQTMASPQSGEPGAGYIREALDRRIPVVTSDKWPIARFGPELVDLARRQGVALLAESTVMSGTPLVGALTEGLAGARPTRLRGVVNATVNHVLTKMASGQGYDEALADAQAKGLAEPDPSADVDGHDSVAKAMILAGLVFGRQLDLSEVERRGVSELTSQELDALRAGRCVREVMTLEHGERGGFVARIQPEIIESADPLFGIHGTMNCVIAEADPVGEVRIAGPGAGPQLAGQGVLSDLIRVAGERQRAT
jgi:homoserine dehydrogenase